MTTEELAHVGVLSAGTGCGIAHPADAPEGLGVMVVDGVAVRIDVTERTVPTAAGIMVGSTDSQVRQAYPQAVVRRHKYDPKGRYFIAAGDDGTTRYVFETDGTRVTRYRLGRAPEVEWVEGCG